MKILMLSQFYPPVIGGEERHVVSLSEGLVKRGHEVVMATMPHPERDEVEVLNGVKVQSLRGLCQRASYLFSEIERPHAPPFPDPELLFRLSRIVAEFKPDIVHGHNWLMQSFLPVKLWSNVGLVSTLHDYGLVCPIKTFIHKGELCDGRGVSKCLKCASAHFGPAMGVVTAASHSVFAPMHRRVVDCFITVSHAVAEQSGLAGGKYPYRVLPTFIPDDLDKLSADVDPRLEQLPPDGYLLFVGDLNRRKGVDILLSAYEQLKSAPPLVLIGRRCTDTPERLPPNVLLFESWPHAAVMHAWSRCLFGLVPSTWVDPCPTVVMEANVVGKTVIVSGHGGLAELVDNGRTGLHVKPGDVESLAAAMQDLLSCPALRETLEKNARAKVETYKASSVIPRIEAIYREAAAAGFRGSRRVPAASHSPEERRHVI